MIDFVKISLAQLCQWIIPSYGWPSIDLNQHTKYLGKIQYPLDTAVYAASTTSTINISSIFLKLGEYHLHGDAMDNLLSLDNPVFNAFAFYAGILLFKLAFTAPFTSYYRMTRAASV